MNKLWIQFLEKGKLKDCPIIDIHCHMGLFYGSHMPYSEPDIMAKRMEISGVKMIIFCHHYSLFYPEKGNIYNIEAVRKYPENFKAYCGINPNYPETIKKDLETFDRYRDIYVGFKLLPDYHRVCLSDDRYKDVFEFADKNKLIVLTHTWGGSVYDGEEEVEKILKKFKNLTLILGHSLHGEWEKAIEFVKKYENVYLELTAVIDERGIIEKFVAEIGSDRILFGTDFPWFNHHYYIGALLGSGISEEDCRKILYLNAQKILNL
ncbi:MAG: amidohydrolase family protein [Candidatus Ratteibacteria bacterium]